MDNCNSYTKILTLGHRALNSLFDGPVVVEEKIDGSQFSFGRFDGVLKCRSHHCDIINDAAGMFQQGVDFVATLNLHDGWTYRGEYLRTPRHNTLTYGRVPAGHVILFDVMVRLEDYLYRPAKELEAFRLGMEVVPCYFEGTLTHPESLPDSLAQESCLGGPIEGIVIKNYNRFGSDGKPLMGKLVSDSFKEKHQGAWKKANPGKAEVITSLIETYKHEGRWRKAVQYQQDAGLLVREPKDIGGIIKRAQADILEECEDEIKEVLYKWAAPQIQRGAVAGLAEWYKEELFAQAVCQ